MAQANIKYFPSPITGEPLSVNQPFWQPNVRRNNLFQCKRCYYRWMGHRRSYRKGVPSKCPRCGCQHEGNIVMVKK